MRDIAIVALSVLIAVVLIKTDVLSQIFISTQNIAFLNSFISGFFFTSIFTTAPAIAALGKLSLTEPILTTAFFGGLGAMCGDFIIFRFVRDKVSGHIFELARIRGPGRRFMHLLKRKHFRWFTLFLGGIILASPLPDELGLSLLGFSKTKTRPFLLLSFSFNFVGIIIIGLVARAII